MQNIKSSESKIFTRTAASAIVAISFALIMLLAPTAVFADSQAPTYHFETIFPVDQWGRPTTSNVAPQHTQNIRRDRHAAVLPPSHGSQTGFFSGEFATNPVNPFAPTFNNNPSASRAVAIEETVFAQRPGEAGVNVRAYGTNAGGFTVTHIPMANTNQTGSQTGRTTIVTPFSDGTIGRITIPALNNRVASVRSGVALSTLNNYVGHFSNTSQWDGNIALASHNRGTGSFFAGIWTLQFGDRIIYETTMGVRIFEVVSINQISENDLTNLNHTHDNTLTLVTCVYGQPSLRWSIVAREVV